MKFQESLETFGCSQLWSNFLHEIQRNLEPDTCFSNEKRRQIVANNVACLLGHYGIMQRYVNSLLEGEVRDAQFREKRAIVHNMILTEIQKEHQRVPTPIGGKINNRGVVEAKEQAQRGIGRLEGLAFQLQESEEFKAIGIRRGEALRVLICALDDAESAIMGRVRKVAERYGFADALGAQLPGWGKDGYYRDTEKPVYSGPQNPPVKPSGDSDIILSQSKCVCVYCGIEVEKKPLDLNTPCEHLICPRCTRMLGTKTGIPNDKRIYDYGDLKHRPGSGRYP